MSESNNTTKKPAGRHTGGRPMGGPGALMPGEKAKDFKGTMRKLLGYLGKFKWTILIVMIIAIASTVFSVIGPRILGEATDELVKGIMNTITGKGGGVDFNKIGQIILLLVGLYVISAVFSYIQGYIMSGVAMKVTYRLRRDIENKIHSLPFKYYDTTTNGEVLSRITNDVDTVSQSLSQSLSQIITSVTMIVGILIMMISISWQLTLVALCIIPASLIFVTLIVKKSQKHFVSQQDYLGHVNGHAEEMYGSHVLVKSFNGEEESTKIFTKYTDKLFQSAWILQKF